MFDFLTEQKRNAIINHPEIGKPYFSGVMTKELFIDNLRAFASQIGITPEEIKRIEKVIEGISSPESQDLIERLFYEAGFEVYLFAGWRNDLNDWPDFDYDRDYGYIKAVHKLRGYSKEEIKSGDGRLLDSRIPFNKILPSISGDSDQIKVHASHGSHEEKFVGTYWGLDDRTKLMLDNGYNPIEKKHSNQYKISDKTHPHYFTCWMLADEIKIENEKKPVTVKQYVDVPKKGLAGKFGRKEQVLKDVVVHKDNWVLKKGVKYMPLNAIVETTETSPAYLMQFLIQKFVPDSGRRSGGNPTVWAIAGKELIEKTASFLLRNPDLYYDFVRGFVPSSMFPNVNKGILSPPFLNTKGIVFQNYTNGLQISVD